MGVGRIEKISRVKGVDNDVSRPFDHKDDYKEEKGRQKAFKFVLQKAIRKEESSAEGVSVPVPYMVDLSRATQSLFYKDGSPLRALGKFNAKG